MLQGTDSDVIIIPLSRVSMRSEVYGSVCVLCVDCYSCSMIRSASKTFYRLVVTFSVFFCGFAKSSWVC